MPKNARSDETILQPASGTGNSLRVTVPAFLINMLDLKKGDRFRWKIDADQIVIKIVNKHIQ